MKLLKEAYGESNELDDFVYLSENRFSSYFKVTLDMRKGDERTADRYSNRYFYSEDAARDYYDKIVKDMKSDKSYYEHAVITLSKVRLNPEEEELEEFDGITEFDDDYGDFEDDYQIDSEEEIDEEE